MERRGPLGVSVTIKYKIQEISPGSMRRCFLPVGQGAFYCESFKLSEKSEPVNVLFDCGTLPRGGMSSRIDKALAWALDGIETIHLAFLSHLHDDHVNGLDVLKEAHHIKIKEIHYPAIQKADQFLMKFWYKVTDQEKGPAWEFCLEPERLKQRFPESETKLVPVEAVTPGAEEDSTTTSNSNTASLPDVAFPDGKLPEGDVDVSDNPFLNWRFQPFNYRRDTLIQKLKEELQAALDLEGEVTDEILSKKWDTPSGKKLIKKAYERVMDGDFNANSMVVFSGPVATEDEKWSQEAICSHSPSCHVNEKLKAFAPGCLYMGDYDASNDEAWKELQKFYANQWEQIGCLQVPHHGACLNFNKELLEMNAIFVASAGVNNKYDHPNECVQLAFQQASKHLRCVTESLGSGLCMRVSCKHPLERVVPRQGVVLKMGEHLGPVKFT